MVYELIGWLNQATWCFGGGHCNFGHYASYLEVSFAVNVLVAGWWDRLRRRLRRLLRESKQRDGLRLGAMKTDIVDEAEPRLKEVDDSRERCKKWTGRFVAVARVCCFVLALLIVAALLMVEAGSKVSLGWMSMCIVVPIVLALAAYVLDSTWSARIERRANEVLDAVLAEAAKKTEGAQVVRQNLPVAPDAADTNKA